VYTLTKDIYVCDYLVSLYIAKHLYRSISTLALSFFFCIVCFCSLGKKRNKKERWLYSNKKKTKIIVSLIYPKYKITISNTISLFEKKVTIYLSISSIEVEVDEIQIEMVEDLMLFVFVVIRKELFERVGMNYSMSRIE